MEREGMTEPEAFRKIQKLSMDRRKSMAEIAEALLLVGERAGEKGRKSQGRAHS